MANSNSPSYPQIADHMTRQVLEDIMMSKTSGPTLWTTGSGGGGGGGAAGQLNLPSVGAAPFYTTNNSRIYNTGTIATSKEMQLTADGDIKFGNVSLKDFMETVSRRLAMLTPNPKLEAEWDELRTLGEAYRALEKDLTEKSQTWDILKRT